MEMKKMFRYGTTTTAATTLTKMPHSKPLKTKWIKPKDYSLCFVFKPMEYIAAILYT